MKPSLPWAKPVAFSIFCFSASLGGLSHAAQSNAPIQIAAPKAILLDLTPDANTLAPVETEVRGAHGASFIKLHFSYFNLPQGAVLEVRDASGKEVYRYRTGQLGPHTIETALGENGKDSFAAMSVNGDLARLSLKLNGAKWDNAIHGVRVRQIMEGFPESTIRHLLREAQVQDANGLLSTCGVNERKDAVCFANTNPEEFERSRPVARLVMSGGLCTTWRVGSDNHMMTNNHCISSQSATQASEVWFNYQNTTCGSKTPAPVTKVTGAQMLKTDGPLDYTLYTVNNFASIASFGNYGLDVRPAIKDEQIFIPQHGAGNPKELAITSDVNTGGVCRIDEPLRDGTGTKTDAGYKCDTIGGSSGSPVLATSSKKVIALHHLGGCPSGTNSGALIEKIWPQIASFFNNVIPNGDVGTPTPVATPITANVAKTDLAGALGSEAFYVLDLASAPSTLKFTTSAGTGDVDMYVKQGAMPSSTTADCKSEQVGNAETCTIASPVAGKYYVLLRGNGDYAGVNLLAASTTNTVSYQNTTVFAIPDRNTTGITSPIAVTRTGASGTVSVDVNITHPYIGDLVVTLVAPNGTVYTLHNRSGGSADNIVKNYQVNVGSVDSSGTWNLRVVDAATADIGKLNSWKITFAN